MPWLFVVLTPFTLRHHVRRISMKTPCLTLCLLDCCREYKLTASEKQAVASEEHPATSKTRGGELPKSGQTITAYACNANDSAYDGKGKHGSDCIHLTAPFALE